LPTPTQARRDPQDTASRPPREDDGEAATGEAEAHARPPFTQPRPSKTQAKPSQALVRKLLIPSNTCADLIKPHDTRRGYCHEPVVEQLRELTQGVTTGPSARLLLAPVGCTPRAE
jgi:hypothetical protein